MAPLAYAQAAVTRPEWWDAELAKLRRSAGDARWRVRELVAAGLQTMLAANWDRTLAALRSWVRDGQPLEVRAAAAAVAEPALLDRPIRGSGALSIQEAAVGVLAGTPASDRRHDDVRVLRRGLGYTVGVAVASVPEPGIELLLRMAQFRRPRPDMGGEGEPQEGAPQTDPRGVGQGRHGDGGGLTLGRPQSHTRCGTMARSDRRD